MGMEGEAQINRATERPESAGGEGLNFLKLMPPEALEEAAAAAGKAGSTIEKMNAESWDDHGKNAAQSGKDQSRLLPDSGREPSSRIEQAFDALKNKMPTVEKLPTGDYLTKINDTEILLTPNNESVTVSKGGQQEVNGELKGMRTDKDGITTVTFADDATVSFDKDGIVAVTRDGVGIGFYKVNLQVGGGGNAGHREFQKGSPRSQGPAELLIPPMP